MGKIANALSVESATAYTKFRALSQGWLSLFLLPSLTQPSVLIMDNAPIHRKSRIKAAVSEAEHEVLFPPKYSPDLNDIEHDFSALKRVKMYAEPDTSLDEIIREYCST